MPEMISLDIPGCGEATVRFSAPVRNAEALCEGAQPLSLRVEGRNVTLTATGPGAARIYAEV